MVMFTNTTEDPVKRVNFCSWFLEEIDILSVVFTDEAIFHLHGQVTRTRYWSTCNPRRYIASRTQSNAKVMVWAGILGTRIIGPYFFTGNVNGKSVFLSFTKIYFRIIIFTTSARSGDSTLTWIMWDGQGMVAARRSTTTLCPDCPAVFSHHLRQPLHKSRWIFRVATKIARFKSLGFFPLGLLETKGISK